MATANVIFCFTGNLVFDLKITNNRTISKMASYPSSTGLTLFLMAVILEKRQPGYRVPPGIKAAEPMLGYHGLFAILTAEIFYNFVCYFHGVPIHVFCQLHRIKMCIESIPLGMATVVCTYLSVNWSWMNDFSHLSCWSRRRV